MNDSKEKLSKKEIRFFKAFELILEILAGIAIAASPALMGLIAAVEIQAKDGAIGTRGFETMKKAWDLGVMIRANGDTIAFSPPLIVENNQIDQMFDATKKAIESIN